MAERVLPFLVQSGPDGEVKEEETTALAAHITKVRFGSCQKQADSSLHVMFNVVPLLSG